MSRILFGLSLRPLQTLCHDSEQRDPYEIAQTHMLSWAFSDHICRKYHQAIYEIPWYQFIWAPRKLISCSGSIGNKIKSQFI